jgi:hypothetical protein
MIMNDPYVLTSAQQCLTCLEISCANLELNHANTNENKTSSALYLVLQQWFNIFNPTPENRGDD